MSATVKELLKLDRMCESYAQMKKGPVFLTHSVRLRNFVESAVRVFYYFHVIRPIHKFRKCKEMLLFEDSRSIISTNITCY